MVLEFIRQQGNELGVHQQTYFRKQLSKIGQFENKLSKLNICFNNPQHGIVQQYVDIYEFLKDVQKVVKSSVDTIAILGTEHHDPSYRLSPLVIHYNPVTRMYEPAMIRDEYITFQFRPAYENELDASKYKSLIPHFKYHLLVSTPQLKRAHSNNYVFYNCAQTLFM